ncbi:peptidyl-prolyl cis-trans isomerase FKBP15-2 isoform X2 [Oryza sativa Japonica Group]|uniref:peptidylprolyl isomerase n=1 Tax=Oryza rufipogon TaxID=4529 RepID=A0A0E0N6R0_ORYRU|nr:peptidyl-prolyl cis-trans isomerase FKBP15-2 isoform X2 [Oryza sativa Japonica Group]KAF2953967.1 hypothetical protein DAI22_01g446700 [Oryza sativa Japonica Group]
MGKRQQQRRLVRFAVAAAVVVAAALILTASAKKSGDVTELQIGVKGSLTDGSVFDSSYDRGDPFEFTLGNGQVIKGWDQGLLGMCVGEKRKLKIPAKMGYGERGSPPKIPGGATLIFDTELIAVNGKTTGGASNSEL